MSSWILFIACTFATSLPINGQVHSDPTALSCYRCDNNERDNFPKCLQTPFTCNVGEVCLIQYGYDYGWHIPHMRCYPRYNCDLTMVGHPIPCPDGGQRVGTHLCQLCCDNNECVSKMVDFLRLDVMASENLYCPGHCTLDKLHECVETGHVCHNTYFCQVKIEAAQRMIGTCLPDTSYAACSNLMRDHQCPVDFTNETTYDKSNRPYCYHSCCLNNECLYPNFGIHMAKAIVPDSGAILPVASTSCTGATSLWEELRGSCQDNLETTFCQSLKNHHDLCHDRLAVATCPETCGICRSVKSIACADMDTLHCSNNKYTDPTFCDDDKSVFECPSTCGHCEKLLESIIVSVLNATSPGTGGGVSLPEGITFLPPGATTPSPVDCKTLLPADCVHIAPLCGTTFLGVVCPQECDLCTSGSPP